ncbi:DNA polymerase/3'-5' exonuclease PolX [candidate division WWE3 bacterium]|uniref:DNA polymerase/3'-5' exonuclease PolX n=1 Tax=candidate division WWE3 bacterium TaxID=2053526 RepID=A0A3A4ZB42_UNCKA|nr:MAG: DNA polymerase/3'-5' exonuclease PolX [candidate division WWE3 bacterium]
MSTKSDKRITNQEIVTILKEVLAAMEVKNANRFKIRAYQNAIAVLENLTTSIQDIWEEGRLDEIPGIGESLEDHLNDLFSRGIVSEFEYAKQGLPEGMFALLGLRGIGAKKAFKLSMAFNLTSRETALERLKKHAEKGEIRVLEGFGEKSELDILESLEQLKYSKNDKPRMLLYKAEQIVERVIEYMKNSPDVLKIDALGSYRRRNPTIGDLDIVVATNNPEKVIEHFVNFPEVGEIIVKGERKAVVVLTNDVQVDIRVSTSSAYGAMLQYNTGSKQHNILLRTYALEKGMSLSEYGIKKRDKLKEFDNEEEFYKELGLPYIPPEIRNGTDEIELAKNNKLPKLLELSDIKGDLQSHTIFSDGINTLDEMVEKAASLGYEYFGVTDHAPSVQSRGYKEVERLIRDYREQINKINNSQDKIRVLFGFEINILADSTLGLPDELMEELDFALASIHTAMNQSKEQMTQRIIKAIENPYITFIGHPSGRLINERDACDIDWKSVFDALVQNDRMIEINSQPNRLDLTDDLVRVALERGIKLLINTDAHATDQLDFMRYGIDVARRGHCEKKDIMNTLPYKEFVKLLRNY